MAIKKFILIVITLFLGTQLSVNAQGGFAGPDRKLIRGACGNDNTEEVWVNIGTENDDQSCYEWSPAEGLKDANKGTTEASPKETTNYKLTRTKPDGTINVDYVVVEVVHEVGTITATPVKCCFQDGDMLSVSDFSISPKGFENCIQILDDAFVIYVNVPQQVVKFEYTAEDGKKTKFSSFINVAPSLNSNVQLAEFAKTFNKVTTLAGKVYDAGINFSELHFIQSTSQEPPPAPEKFEVTYSASTKCCSVCNPIFYGTNIGISAIGSYSIGVSRDLMLAGIPYILEAGVRAQVSAQASISASLNYTLNCEKEKVALEIPVKLGGSISGGVYARALVIFDVSASINYSAQTGLKIGILPTPSLKGENVCGDVKLIGTATAYSLVSYNIEYVLGKVCLF